MNYDRKEIIHLIDLAFRHYATDESFQQELPISHSYDIQDLQNLLKTPSVLSALLILFNGACSRRYTSETDLQRTAEQYPLSFLELSNRTQNALSRQQGLVTVGDLFKLSDSEIAHIRGLGPGSRALEEIRASRMKFIRDFQSGLIR